MKKLSSSAFRSKNLFNPVLILSLLFIIIIGIVVLYSTLILPTGGLGDKSIFIKQLLFLAIGLIIFFAISHIDLSYLKHWQLTVLLYIATILLLIVTLFSTPIKNVRRWIVIGGVQIQPSEIAKLTVIIITATIFSMKERYNEWVLFSLSFLFLIPILVLIYIQPSGSMTLLTLGIWFILAFLGLNNPLRNSVLLTIIICTVGAFLLSSVTANNLWYLLLVPALVVSIFGYYVKSNWKIYVILSAILALILGLFTTVTWHKVLKPYQKERIIAFVNPAETDPDKVFNVNQSKIAIGSGKILGKGFGNGTQSKRNFLPEFRTDFIFASYSEEFGLVGALFLMMLYAVIIVFCFITSINNSGNPMFSLISIGVGIKLLLEIFINIGTNTGGIPATGIPLPLMSAGGTITVITLVSLGLVHNISLKTSEKVRTEKTNIIDIYED